MAVGRLRVGTAPLLFSSSKIESNSHVTSEQNAGGFEAHDDFQLERKMTALTLIIQSENVRDTVGDTVIHGTIPDCSLCSRYSQFLFESTRTPDEGFIIFLFKTHV